MKIESREKAKNMKKSKKIMKKEKQEKKKFTKEEIRFWWTNASFAKNPLTICWRPKIDYSILNI